MGVHGETARRVAYGWGHALQSNAMLNSGSTLSVIQPDYDVHRQPLVSSCIVRELALKIRS